MQKMEAKSETSRDTDRDQIFKPAPSEFEANTALTELHK